MQYIGIDISEDRLDVATPEKDGGHFDYTDAGIKALLATIQTPQLRLVVLEATGGIEHALAVRLASAGIAVAIVNPRQVRDFARSTGAPGKTGRVDARVLALFAEQIQSEAEVGSLPERERQVLVALEARRCQLAAMLEDERERLRHADTAVRPDLETHIGFLEARLAQGDRRLRDAIRRSPLYRADDNLLQNVPDVGEEERPESNASSLTTRASVVRGEAREFAETRPVKVAS